MPDPTGKVVGLEFFLAIDLHHLRVPDTQKVQGPPHRTGMHRLPEPVQHKHGSLKHGIHLIAQIIWPP
jgi:hypothetical protein